MYYLYDTVKRPPVLTTHYFYWLISTYWWPFF